MSMSDGVGRVGGVDTVQGQDDDSAARPDHYHQPSQQLSLGPGASPGANNAWFLSTQRQSET